jgi:hypothetical protein
VAHLGDPPRVGQRTLAIVLRRRRISRMSSTRVALALAIGCLGSADGNSM